MISLKTMEDDNMNVKKFFKALSAGVEATFGEDWPFIRTFMTACLSAVAGFLFTVCICNIVELAITVGAFSSFFGVIGLQTFEHCIEAVDYAEKNAVDMKTAWALTGDIGSFE